MWPTVILSGFLLIVGLLYILSHMPSNKYNYAWLRTFFSSISSSTKKSTDLTQAINQESSVFTRDELEKLFSTFDKNGDGFITKRELLESLKNMNIFMSTKEVDEMVSKLDADGDGLIDFQEFCVLSESLLGQESGEPVEEEILKEAFDVFDKDKDGLISEMELGMLLCALGLKEGKQIEDCREMIRKVDDDGDGMVNFKEFKKMMKGGRKLGLAPN